MFSFLFPRARGLIGLDFLSHEVCLLEIKKFKNNMLIKNLAASPLPDGVILEGRIQKAGILKKLIEDIVKKTKTQNLKTAIAIPAECVIEKKIKFPKDFEALEIQTEIMNHIDQYLPHSHEYHFDFVILNSGEDLFCEVLLVAAKNEEIKTYLEVVNEAGLAVRVIDIDLYARARAAKYLGALGLSLREQKTW